MSRDLKRVLIGLASVLVLAFFAQQLVSPGESEGPTFSEFLDELERGEVESVAIDAGRGELEVVPGPGATVEEQYETDYPYGYDEALVKQLRAKDVPFEVDSGGGGSVASWVVYLLPLAIFGLFWRWLARRLAELAPRDR